MTQRFGLIEITDEGQKVTFLDEISLDEFKVLEKIILELHAFKGNQNLHNLFIYNFIELSDFFQSAANQLVRERVYSLQNEGSIPKVYLHANRLFLNFLSSFRTLIDHTSTYLNRRYGGSSKELTAFTKKTNELYDNYFEYGFMYKLRNYAQHCGFPISSISFKQSREEQTENSRTGTLNAFFERDRLLKDFDWGNKVKEGLSKQPNKLPAMWTVGNFYRLVESLFTIVREVQLPTLTQSVEIIENACKNIPKDKGEVCLFYDFAIPHPNSFENSKFEILSIPFNIMDDITSNLEI